ncbi:Acetyltransferase (GNAT) family protein [Mucilaginibacter pineti]|uniref:Acetyltransferase (GNAT) family protein n=1 Tax=Mucilaginibacter pineti TaxID=1391627 RepID=A0A1G7EQS3_9SPHI|nr:GNAT family N-acetyltransferase [Mucilaginibacter pineti]SDE66021.1 Acetyltransferase (GNAT) family protein [Mucilaginibacter pineti]
MMRKADAADQPLVAGILAQSFSDNLSVNYVTAGTDQQLRRSALMNYAVKVCSLFGEVLISEDAHACALLLYPEQKKTTFLSLLLDLELVWNCTGISKALAVMKREKAIHSLQLSGHNAYLWFIGVNPLFQHKGIGSRLLSEVIAYCEKQHRTVILETSTLKNIPWYKSFGFQTYATLDLGYKLFFLKKEFSATVSKF